jgi:DNA polymerase-1
MSHKKLFLLDAMALIYRAHFAFIRTPRLTSKGVNTSALFGFTNTLLDLLRKEKPTHLGVAFDTAAPTFRHIEYPEYKAQREAMPEDIVTAIPLTKRLLKTLNIPILELDGYEADDIIGTLARRGEAHGYDVYMVTPDKDYAQLVTDHIFVYKPGRQGNDVEILNPAKVEEVMGVKPTQVADLLGLKGDTVDNIPGIPKIGDKTAVELIKEFGSVEEVVRRADEIKKNAIRESVKAHAEQGLLSKKLAVIFTETPIDWDEEFLHVGNADKESFLELMQELEFKATAQRVLDSGFFGDPPKVQQDLFGNTVEGASNAAVPAQEEQPAIPSNFSTIETREHHYKALETDEEIRELIARIEQHGEFCFDTETTSLDSMQADLICITFSVKPHEAFMVFFPDRDKERKAHLIALLRPLFESTTLVKIGQNIKYDMLVLRNHGLHVAQPIFDTMLAHYLLDPDKGHSMDAMSEEILTYSPVPITALIGKRGKGQLTMRQVPSDKLLDYACEDADITYSLKENLAPRIAGHFAEEVFGKMEIPLVHVLADMEFAGMKIDEHALREYSRDLEQQLRKLEREIYQMAGVEFNINSPAQLGEILFGKLGLGGAAGKKTKTGQYSTREEVLVELAEEHELPALILRFRKLGKLKSTYVDALPDLINPNTGRIHTTFNQAVAATGRLASNNPNLQNIPIRSDEGREIRKAFIAEEGFELLSADYSQVELRLVAHLAGDPAMIEAFKDGHDIHRATAARVFGVPMEDVTGDMRSKAKMVNFGIIYGISAFGLAQRLKIPRSEAADIINSYFRQYSHIKAYMDSSIQFARDHGYVQTILGRRRFLPDIHSRNQTVRGFAERNAINAPVQGSAADLIKLAMIHIHRKMKELNLRSRMILQVHDELVFEVAPEEKEQLIALVKHEMEHAIPHMKVPMLAEAGVGKNWLEAH